VAQTFYVPTATIETTRAFYVRRCSPDGRPSVSCSRDGSLKPAETDRKAAESGLASMSGTREGKKRKTG
jgi:hypothetical protein